MEISLKKGLQCIGKGTAILIVGSVIFFSIALVVLVPVGFIMERF